MLISIKWSKVMAKGKCLKYWRNRLHQVLFKSFLFNLDAPIVNSLLLSLFQPLERKLWTWHFTSKFFSMHVLNIRTFSYITAPKKLTLTIISSICSLHSNVISCFKNTFISVYLLRFSQGLLHLVVLSLYSNLV